MKNSRNNTISPPSSSGSPSSSYSYKQHLDIHFSAIQDFQKFIQQELYPQQNYTTTSITIKEPMGSFQDLITPGTNSYIVWNTIITLPNLQRIQIQYDTFSIDNWTFPIIALSTLFQSATQLKVVTVSHLELRSSIQEQESNEWNIFYHSLQHHNQLQQIFIRSCSFGIDTLQLDPLIESLSCISTLQKVEISARRSRHIGTRSCKSSEDGGCLERLCQSSTLQSLSLGNLDGLLHEDVEQIVKGFMFQEAQGGSYLEELSLWQCNLNDQDVISLARLFHKSQVKISLKILDLSRNDIGNKGCFELVHALQGNTTLTSLDLSRNSNIDTHGQQALLELVSTNFTLTELQVDWDSAEIETEIETHLVLNHQRHHQHRKQVQVHQQESQSQLHQHNKKVENENDEIDAKNDNNCHSHPYGQRLRLLILPTSSSTPPLKNTAMEQRKCRSV